MLLSEQFRRFNINYLYHYTHSDNVANISRHKALLSKNSLNYLGHLPRHITDEASRMTDEYKRNNNSVFLVFSHQHPFIHKLSKYGNMPLSYYSIDVSVLDRPWVKVSNCISIHPDARFFTVVEALKYLKIHYYSMDFIEDASIWNEIIRYEVLVPNIIMLQ